jgi:hypothetical protein
MTAAIPSDSEISSAVNNLFSATIHCERTIRWNALVPTDMQVPVPPPDGQKHVSHVPAWVARETVAFIHDVDGRLRDSGSSPESRIRMMLVGYCHIMESELMPTLIWNQLRLLHRLAPSWHFTRTTRKGDIEVFWLPNEKYKEIVSLAQPVGQPIGEIVSSVWNANLRNNFSHSRYWLSGTSVLTQGDLSPISRKRAFGTGGSFTFDEVRERYRAAKTLMSRVGEEHAKACKTYK